MAPHITHHEILRNRQVSHHSMDPDYALRKVTAMERAGMKAARKRLGLTQADMAERLDVSVPQISRWEGGKDGIPDRRFAALTAAYEASIDELIGFPAVAIEPNAQVLRYEGASMVELPRDVPIYGTSLGAPLDFGGKAIEQTTLNTAEVIGHLKRPTVLNGQKAVYGLYVQGSSMAPRFEDGETIFVQDSTKGRPPQLGDDVVVYLRDDEVDDGATAAAVLVKRLVRRTASYYEFEQFNPTATFRIETTRILRADRVIPWGELLS